MKKIKKNILGFIIGAIIFSCITVYALDRIYTTNVGIDTTNISSLTEGSTLNDALNGLYEKAESTTCPTDNYCFTKKIYS